MSTRAKKELEKRKKREGRVNKGMKGRGLNRRDDEKGIRGYSERANERTSECN